jgi:hypothetical protein
MSTHSLPQPEPESSSDNRNNLTEGEYNLARFHQHVAKASAVLERRLLRGTPPHVSAVFRRVQMALECGENAIRLVTRRGPSRG